MRDGICSKCGKREVRLAPERGGQGHGQSLGISTFKTALLSTYVCTACGWMEQWVEKREDLQRIAEKWERPS